MRLLSTIAKPSSGYKPKLSIPLLVIGLIWFGLMQGLPFLRHSSKVLGTSESLDTSEIISFTNLERTKAGLTPLQPDQKLMLAAEAKANDMVTFGYWDHYSPSKRPPWSFILESGYDYHFAGENLAKDFYETPKLMNAWMNSPAHRDNILNNNYENIGVAILQTKLNDKDTILVVQMFATRFNAQDVIAAQDRANAMTATATGLLTPANSWQALLDRPFQWTQITGLLLITVLSFSMTKKIIEGWHTHRPLTIHYWGHLMVLLMCGLLIVLTREGDIL